MLIMVTVFSYLPLSGWMMAFRDYKLGFSIFSGEFTGLRQFRIFFVDASDAMYTIRNTVCINLLSLAVNLSSACFFALVLNEMRLLRLKKMVQSFSYFPYFVSWVIGHYIFNSFLAEQSGVINIVLQQIGLTSKGISFLGDPKYSWGLMVFASLWKYLGSDTIIFLAAISGIDQEQYEAADIDGASRFQKISYITLPALMPTVVMILILNSGTIFNSNFDQFFLFTNSLNWQRMEVLDMYIYRYGLKLLNFPYATAVGIVRTIVSIIMFLIVNQIAKRVRGQSLI